ncbi:urokinase-type plasminogen activator-like [Myripristis murdjan]|uniref:urokinase-type plasminogen activator-like n=1 Tax=Myripristis murdjan TaxID=586833 RepID=UPI0011761D40|nr:urokinase-type plasminogen activator-like [Myripristis murdjan]
MKLFVILALVVICSNTVSARNLSRRKPSWPHSTCDTHRVRPSARMCLLEDGTSYRGSVSVSAYGHRCLRWFKFEWTWGAAKGLGPHNYCRNPDQSLTPWCRVKRGTRIVRELCNIPKCPVPKPPVPPAVDTELTCGEMPSQKINKIVGGTMTSIESQPWVAAIFWHHDFWCGGSLIAPSWVLTAAHCLQNDDGTVINVRHLSVYLGKSNIRVTDVDREQKFTVEQMIIHPKYKDLRPFNNDIALLKIKSQDGKSAVRTPSVRTVCLPPHLTMLPPGVECSIAGFGKESDSYYAPSSSNFLKQAKVTLLSESVCKRDPFYAKNVTSNMFCAASPTWSTDSCQGDSGGPLMCEVSGRMFVFGVVSWGEGCAKQDKPGVYTRVTNYNNWIAEKTGLPAYTAGVMYPQK